MSKKIKLLKRKKNFSFQNDKITELKNLVTAGTNAANAKMNKSGILKVSSIVSKISINPFR